MCAGDGSSERSDKELTKLFIEGDMDAFDLLFKRYRRGLLAYVTGFTGSSALAEDVVQDAFVRLAEIRGRINPSRGISGLLYRLARNRAVDELRRRKTKVSATEKLEMMREETRIMSPAEKMVAADERDVLRAALLRIPAKERDILMMHFYGDLTYREISEVLRRPLGTVLWQSRSAVRRLKMILGRSEPIAE